MDAHADDSAETTTSRPAGLDRYRWWADQATLWLVIIVATGATVRLTGSGLGCPDWPSCSGIRPVPEASFHPMVEFANRLIAFPVMVFTVGALVLAQRLRPVRRELRMASLLVVLTVIANIVVGGVTVRMGLPPEVVSVHFIINAVALMAASWASVAARHDESVRLRVRGQGAAAASAIALLATAAITIAFGVLTTASGPHSGGGASDVVERLDGLGGWAVVIHARSGFVFLGLAVLLTVWRRRSRAGARDLLLLTVLVAVQVLLGEMQFRNGLPWQIVLAHVINAMVLWTVTCVIAWRALAVPRGADGGATDPSGAAPRRPIQYGA